MAKARSCSGPGQLGARRHSRVGFVALGAAFLLFTAGRTFCMMRLRPRRLVACAGTGTVGTDVQMNFTEKTEDSMKLLKEIAGSGSPESVLEALEAHSMDPRLGFGFTHASAALHSLAQKRDILTPQVVGSPTLKRLVQTTKGLLKSGDTHVHTLSVMMWSIAALRDKAPEIAQELVPPLVQAALADTEWTAQRHLGRVIWATATLHEREPDMLRLLPVLMDSAEGRLPQLNAHNVANVLWSIATLREESPELQGLIPGLVSRAKEVQGDFNRQHAGNIVWAADTLKKEASILQQLVPAMAKISCPDGVGLDDQRSRGLGEGKTASPRGGVGGGWST